MQNLFYQLADFVQSKLQGSEFATCEFNAEDSDFVRFNKNAVRQAGTVHQRDLSLDLIDGQRHARGGVTLSGHPDTDRSRLETVIKQLRAMLPHLADDPHLLYSEEVRSSEKHGENELPAGPDVVGSVLREASGKDLVGIYSSGGIYSGFANSLGQRNWYSTYTFNLDWSLYHHEDKAVKSGYAGFDWRDDELAAKFNTAQAQLAILTRTSRTIDPGKYRVYLSPVAMCELVQMVSWGGFGLKDHRTKQTSLLKMVEGDTRLSPSVSIRENTDAGVAPDFQGAGFIKPPSVSLISDGCFANCLTSPRSAKEYGVPTNGASTWESPQSIEMNAGELLRDDVVRELRDGLYINNLWYLNYSDRPNCRITGMTHFATFWVEGGQVVAPVNVMRFDETIYRLLGDHLIGLTSERDFILDAETYGGRSTSSGRFPGALIDEFTLTL